MRRLFIKFLIILATVMVGGFRYAGPPRAQACVNCVPGNCGGSCSQGYKCTKTSESCYDCTLDSSCGPTPTRAYNTPTPPPPPSDGSPTPTPDDGSGNNEDPTPTPNPDCIYSEPSAVYYGSCDGSTSNCDSSGSTVTCENGQCKYSGNLNPCPNASCPTYWVPSGWGCGSNEGDKLGDLQVYVNPNNVTDLNDPDRHDVSMGVNVNWKIKYKEGTRCENRLSFNIGPDPNHLKGASGCTDIWSGSSMVWCVAHQDGTNADDNLGAVTDDGWQYPGGALCVQAALGWITNPHVDGVYCGQTSYKTVCVYPACQILSASVSTPQMCLADNSNAIVPYTLNWTADNQTSADHITAYWLKEDADGNISYMSDGFNPANPLDIHATSTSINLPAKSSGYGFYICCSGGSKSGDYNCAYVGSDDQWVYRDSGAPKPDSQFGVLPPTTGESQTRLGTHSLADLGTANIPSAAYLWSATDGY